MPRKMKPGTNPPPEKPDRMTRVISMRIDSVDLAQILHLADKSGVSMSEWIRQTLHRELAWEEE